MARPPAPCRVLFLCTGNSCRSQMAEGFARALRSDRVEAWSAGTAPTGRVDPRAVTVMAELEVDLSGHRSKHIDDLPVPLAGFDYVVTVCADADRSCPKPPAGVRVVHVGFEDPPRLAAGIRSEAEALVHYRMVRNQIREFIDALPECLERGGWQVGD